MKKYFDGYDIGCLVMKSWVPKPPGHISCASNYDFPIYYYPVENTDNKVIHSGSKNIVPKLIESAKNLKEMGCNALVTSCGYFGHFQREIANQDIMPTYLSCVTLIPFIFRLIGNKKSIIVICYNKEKLTKEMLLSCGVKEEYHERLHIYDIIGQPELGKIITDCGEYDISKARKEVVSVAKTALNDFPDAGAILLECTDLPPHSFAIQAATNLPVFDSTSMVKFVHKLAIEEGL